MNKISIHSDPSRNQKERDILLIEPNYRNKYPPLGLMKLSAYHRQLGDSVVFFKGDYKKYIFDERIVKCIEKIKSQKFYIDNWEVFESLVRDYLKYRHIIKREAVLELVPPDHYHIVENIPSYLSLLFLKASEDQKKLRHFERNGA